MWELWPSDATGGGELSVFWLNEKQQYEAARLDPSTGRALAESPTAPVRGTQAGHHFVDFHCELHAGAA
ncbi:hypothetical protein [Variovorax ginsengisoli]|uniref:Uncharacterized protein n=1 Tax=Variovorax ginsengisoli TaxID=363844 RepID=A0ABT9S536_9BURK|nr:hypothetical protein [Variovorax ginsengisoli]MDP9899466.1 hypothetical protein [Variovorax ginsengisoli]